MNETFAEILTERPDSTNQAEVHDVAVEALSETQWRVCDRAVAPDDGRHVIGLIEHTDEQFEAMEIGPGHAFAWYAYPTLAQAHDHFTRSAVGHLVQTNTTR